MRTKTDLCSLSATELLQLYRGKQASPVEATRAVLDGVPVSIKDLLLTKGWPTLRGSKTIDPKGPWNDDAPAVARLREHGAVLLGKTTTPEFGWKGVTDGPLTIGTDGGGSIRIPCGFAGLFGLKPSFGRVPAWPLSPMGTVAHVGPMTRSVEDAGPLFSAHWFPGAASVVRATPPAKRRLIDKGLLETARMGERVTTGEYFAAMQKRGALGVLMNRFHEQWDLLVTPTLPLAAFEAGREVANLLKEKRWTDWTPFSYPFNLTQQPAATIPCGLTKKGLPVGLHIVGPRYADALVLRAARAFESAHPIPLPDVAGLDRR